MTNNTFHPAAWLCYINGIEIPCPQVTVSYGVWMIPEATLSFPPHKLLQRLGAEDKLEVVIFYLDSTLDRDNPEFRLLFEGEIIGWTYSSSDRNQSIAFNAIADISVFSQLYFFFMNTVDAVVTSASLTDPATISEPGVFYPFSIFKKGLLSVSNKVNADITRPYDILQNILAGMTSNKIPAHRRTIPGVNFFSRWARKRNFVNRFAALPLFEDGIDTNGGVFPIFQSAQSALALDTMKEDLAASVGNAGSMWDVLRTIFGIVYCELAMIPTAPCFRVNVEDGRILSTASEPPSAINKTNLEPLRLINYFVKPQMLFAVPPACNVIFPSMAPSIGYSENYMQQPTRTYVNDSLITGILQQNQLTSAALRVAYPPEVDAAMRNQISGTNQTNQAIAPGLLNNGKNVLVWPEEFYKGPVVNRTNVPAWFTLLKNRSQAKKDTTTKTQDSLSALYSLYTEYEHYRTRYEKRGGAVDMAWNPYLVPGFPCVVFDRRSTAFDLVGYLMQVNHTLSSTGGGTMRTAINYTYGRTIQEMLDILKSDMSRLGVVLASAPSDPIDTVRSITQDVDSAESMYRTLFFGREATPGKPAAFDIKNLIGYVNTSTDKIDPIVITGPRMQEKSVTFTGNSPAIAEASAAANQPVVDNIDPTKELQPLAKYSSLFDNYDAAMKYVSRPICTLNEYISFIHGGKPITELINEGQVENKITKYNTFYYTRIKKLRQGPGERPSASVTGTDLQPPREGTTNNVAIPFVSGFTGVNSDFPQTRLDWDSILLEYRNDILNRIGPKR